MLSGRGDDPIFIGPELPLYPHFYHERSIHLVHLDEAYIMGNSGNLHMDCRLYTGGHHCSADLQSFPVASNSFTTIEVKHRVASIVQHNTANFYHWCAEAMARLLFLNATVFADEDNADVKLLAPPFNMRHVRETMDLPELASLSQRLLQYTDMPDRTRMHLSKGVFSVDWIHREQDDFKSLEGNSWGVYSPPKQALELTRDFFHQVLKNRNRFPNVKSKAFGTKHSIV